MAKFIKSVARVGIQIFNMSHILICPTTLTVGRNTCDNVGNDTKDEKLKLYSFTFTHKEIITKF